MIKIIRLFSVFVIMFSGYSCSRFSCSSAKQDYVVAFYNVENLFDTINDPGTRDGGFTPEGKIPWNTERYHRKLSNISEVLSSIDNGNPPEIAGLCEVENRKVIEDLINSPNLMNYNYRIIHHESPDERGIDNAIIYQHDCFNPLFDTVYPVRFPFDTSDRTRDILYVKGMIDHNTIHLFVNHWHSRGGGQKKSEPKRIETAKILKGIIDSLFQINTQSQILIMGDFNDNPDNRSLYEILKARKPDSLIEPESLYNLSYNRFLNNEGTCYWRSWDMFDQIIVSSSLLQNGNSLNVQEDDQFIFKPDWILYFPEKGSPKPNRTRGRSYYGGYSDHLPVYVGLDI